MRPIDPESNTLDQEHPQLASATRSAIGLVEQLHGTIGAVEGQSAWMQHSDFAWRAWYLVDHLASALDDADRARYASAFATLRTALEHELVDRLLLMADRYIEVIDTMTKEQFLALEAELAAREADWTMNTTKLERWGNGARLLREGHNIVHDGVVVERISPYWVVLQHHNATLGPPTAQALFATGIIGTEQLEAEAKRNATLYSRYLKWDAVLRNLVVNSLIDEAHSPQLDAHYRWLSAFTHATQTGYDIIDRERGSPSWGGRRRSHLLGELVVLYAATFAADELQWFCDFVDARPHLITLTNRLEINAAIAHIREITGYFWWPGTPPTQLDRVEEANHRAWKSNRPGDTWPAAPDPASLADDEVGYYPDPLERLKKMHDGFREMTTGLDYSPPW